jgi:hypothetical protein
MMLDADVVAVASRRTGESSMGYGRRRTRGGSKNIALIAGALIHLTA